MLYYIHMEVFSWGIHGLEVFPGHACEAGNSLRARGTYLQVVIGPMHKAVLSFYGWGAG